MNVTQVLSARQARDALKAGRPEEAERHLHSYGDPPYTAAGTLPREIARGFATRGHRHLVAGRVDTAWDDLYAAETLNTGEPVVAELRSDLCKQGLASCRAALDAGDPIELLRRAKSLRDRRCTHPQLDLLSDAGQSWALAKDFADRGEFSLAKHSLDGVKRKMGFLPLSMEKFAEALITRHEQFTNAFALLSENIQKQDYPAALKAGDDALAAAPAHTEAQRLRDTVWKTIRHAAAPERPTTPITLLRAGPAPRDPNALAAVGGLSTGHTSMGMPGLPKRFFLWVDGVGGYLVCLGARVTVGQATGADSPVDIPVFADVARVHAEILRDAEGYILESARGVQVNGAATDRRVLTPGDRVTVGSTCQFIFRQPVPVVPTAMLELASGHRFQVAVDAVVLMAETLVLGPGDDAHIVVPHADSNVIVYRGKEGLGVRYEGNYVVADQPAKGRALLPVPSTVVADQFSFTVEEAKKR